MSSRLFYQQAGQTEEAMAVAKAAGPGSTITSGGKTGVIGTPEEIESGEQ